MIFFLILGCVDKSPEFVTMSGSVFSDKDSEITISGATMDVYDIAMEEIDSVVTDESGSFDAQVRFGSFVFLDLQADGHVRTGFSGAIGTQDYLVPDGTLWMRSDEEQAVVDAAFAGCEDMDLDGWVEGEILMALPQDEGVVKSFVETGWAKVLLEDGVEREACYLDAEGLFDPEAVLTGPTGRFLLPNVSGMTRIRVGYDLGDVEIYSGDLTVFVPEGGAVILDDSLWMPLPS